MRLNKKSTPGESSIQTDARNYSVLRRWKIAIKIMWGSENGMPDFFYARKTPQCPHCGRHGEILMIEYKDTGEEPTAQQLLRHQELADCGINVVWVDNLEDAKRHLR